MIFKMTFVQQGLISLFVWKIKDNEIINNLKQNVKISGCLKPFLTTPFKRNIISYQYSNLTERTKLDF